MCGIFGYIGTKDPLTICLTGLQQLEYRGYDSTGIAGLMDGKITIFKEAGKLSKLLSTIKPLPFHLAIAHTRWATHGKVTQPNAHPHLDASGSIALIHNGITENYDQLKAKLLKEGVPLVSETDTEVIVQLIARSYRGDLVEAVQLTLPLLQGHFALVVIHKDHPGSIVAAARECPLSIGYDDQQTEAILSSDPNAFLPSTRNALFLRADQTALVQKGRIEIFDKERRPLPLNPERLDAHYKPPTKEGYPHYMLKEIHEQPTTIQNAYIGRIGEQQIQLETLPPSMQKAQAVWFIGCGTSAHAGLIGSLFLEDLAHIPAHAEIASEARYRIIPPGTLVIAISQSGETADTLSAVREIRARGHQVLGICNVAGSTLTRETDACLFLKAGPEMSVCSTKAFTSQITLLYLFAIYMAGRVDQRLKQIPAQIQQVLDHSPHIEKLAKKYSRYNDFFFMGRRYMFPTCLEAALKLKEISYVNANGYPAGELKHGPIALLDAQFPVIAFCANKKTEEKIISNLQEVKARGAPILTLAPETLKSAGAIADDVIWLPPAPDELSPFASSVAGQLFAYYFAKERGCDIDQPRNLAKSVTVE